MHVWTIIMSEYIISVCRDSHCSYVYTLWLATQIIFICKTIYRYIVLTCKLTCMCETSISLYRIASLVF